MTRPSHLRIPNPHLGAYYSIITSAFVSLIITADEARRIANGGSFDMNQFGRRPPGK